MWERNLFNTGLTLRLLCGCGHRTRKYKKLFLELLENSPQWHQTAKTPSNWNLPVQSEECMFQMHSNSKLCGKPRHCSPRRERYEYSLGAEGHLQRIFRRETFHSCTVTSQFTQEHSRGAEVENPARRTRTHSMNTCEASDIIMLRCNHRMFKLCKKVQISNMILWLTECMAWKNSGTR